MYVSEEERFDIIIKLLDKELKAKQLEIDKLSTMRQTYKDQLKEFLD